MTVRRLVIVFLAGVAGLCASVGPSVPSAGADQPTETTRPRHKGYTLTQCLAMAERNYPTVRQARAKAAYYQAQLDEARTAPFSQWKFRGGIALAPSVRGTAVYSPDTDVALKSNMGLAWSLNVEGVVPLWTFGKISNLLDAAEWQNELGRHEVAKAKNQLRLDVRKAYYGLILARSAQDLLREAAKKLAEAIGKLAKQVEAGDADEIDLFKLQTYRAEVDARMADAEKFESMALAGLRFYTGAVGHFDIASTELTLPKHHLGPVQRYLLAARIYNPDINRARIGVRAREAQAALAKAKLFPDIGIGISAGWTRAPEVTDQLNPFVKDNANVLGLGLGLVFQWNMDLLPQSARLAQARAQLEEMRATERLALGGVGIEVENTYAEVVAAKKREKAYAKAEAICKKWLIAVSQGIDMGTEDESALTDPAKEYAQQRYNHLNAIMDVNIAMSKLALVTGWDAIAPH